jgi:hypothetical protein
MHAALHEIGLIAGYRLADVVSSDAASETLAMLGQIPTASACSLITEWMRAANLSVCRAGPGLLIGVSSAASADSRMLIMGLHYDPDRRSLVSEGRLGCAMGIAVSQQLREQARQLQFDLAVFSSPYDQTHIGDSSLGALSAPRGCISMESVDADRGESREILAALRTVGLSNSYFLIASRDTAELVVHSPPSLVLQQLQRAVGALQEFLLHTQPMTDEKGQSLNHG